MYYLERRMQPARGRFARFDLDRQIASTFPAHWKVGPAPVFWASQPLEPAEWLALLILKAGDVDFLAWTSGRIPTKWSLSLPPGGRDCWLPHDFGCWTLLAARWWSGVDNNNNNNNVYYLTSFCLCLTEL